MKSILVSIYELQAEEVTVIGHHDCGMSHVNTSSLYQKMINQGIEEKTLHTLTHGGIDFHDEFHGFKTVEESVEQSVSIIRSHPLLPSQIKVHGLVIDPGTGKVDVVMRDQ